MSVAADHRDPGQQVANAQALGTDDSQMGTTVSNGIHIVDFGSHAVVKPQKIRQSRLRHMDHTTPILQRRRDAAKVIRGHDPMLDDCLMLRAECLHATGTNALGWGQADDWYPELVQKGQRASIATVASLVKLMASDPERHGLALDLAIRAGEGLCQWRDTAESTVGGHLALARALLAISEAEARAHFDAATASAERLGEENYDRWRALLALAEAASHGSEDQAELAYRLARFAEPTHEHLGKSSYLEWERTAQALARLSPASSLAILSRWADRGFGIPDDQLEVVLHTLVTYICAPAWCSCAK